MGLHHSRSISIFTPLMRSISLTTCTLISASTRSHFETTKKDLRSAHFKDGIAAEDEAAQRGAGHAQPDERDDPHPDHRHVRYEPPIDEAADHVLLLEKSGIRGAERMLQGDRRIDEMDRWGFAKGKLQAKNPSGPKQYFKI